MTAKKFIKNQAIESWKVLSAYSAFCKLHKGIYSSPDFKKTALTKAEKKEYRNY